MAPYGKTDRKTDGKTYVLIGTSGSTDYLRDGTGDKRFWPVVVPPAAAPADEAQIDGQICDGLHDEDAPVLHLCSRCFPSGTGRDLSDDDEDDDYDGAHRDDTEEME